jgi:hypothetical protein
MCPSCTSRCSRGNGTPSCCFWSASWSCCSVISPICRKRSAMPTKPVAPPYPIVEGDYSTEGGIFTRIGKKKVPERFGEVLFGAAFPQSVASKLWSLDQRCRRSVGVLSLLEWALWFRAFLTRCLRSPLLGRRLPHYPSRALRFLLAQRSGTQAARGSQRQGLSLCTRAASSGFPNDALIIAHRTPVCQGVKGVLRANWGEIRGKFSEIRGRLGARRDPNFVRLLIWSAYPAVSVAKNRK